METTERRVWRKQHEEGLKKAGLCARSCGEPVVLGRRYCETCVVKNIWWNSQQRAREGGHSGIAMSLEGFVSWYPTALASCNGYCECCGEPFGARGPVVDHDHKAGVVRGIVCDPCNRTEAHGLERLQKVLDFVKRASCA